jgi:hypothetical protein
VALPARHLTPETLGIASALSITSLEISDILAIAVNAVSCM